MSSMTRSSSRSTLSSSSVASTGTSSSIAARHPGRWTKLRTDASTATGSSYGGNSIGAQKRKNGRKTTPGRWWVNYWFDLTRRWLIVRIGAGVVLVDSFVRWSRVRGYDTGWPLAPSSGSSWPKSMNDGEAAVAFLRILLGCLVETASFHGGITLASFLVLTSLDRVARWRKRAISPPSTIRQQLRYSHISLCLFYSSLTKFMLLVALAIWGPQDRRDTPPPTYAYKIPFEGPLWHLLDDDVLDRTWLVRNLLGGVSAGFGLRVLDCHPFFTSLIVLSGCLIKTGIVGIVREFVGPGTGIEETWLAYSIP